MRRARQERGFVAGTKRTTLGGILKSVFDPERTLLPAALTRAQTYPVECWPSGDRSSPSALFVQVRLWLDCGCEPKLAHHCVIASRIHFSTLPQLSNSILSSIAAISASVCPWLRIWLRALLNSRSIGCMSCKTNCLQGSSITDHFSSSHCQRPATCAFQWASPR
jgi:hypothetical protein